MDKSTPQMPDLMPDLLSGSNPNIDRSEILNAIPSRAVVDTLMIEFFANTDTEPSKLVSLAVEYVLTMYQCWYIRPHFARR
jgi:fatty acid/phospholipid biosynthesis enzyme